MKKAIRNTLLATSFCMALGAVVALGLTDGTTVHAQTVDSSIITIVPGASVRYPEKEADSYVNDGLRFSSIIDKTQYDGLVSGGYTVTTGTFILPWNYYATAAVNEENCFTNPKYYWETEVKGEYSVEDTTGKYQILNVEGTPYVPEGETDYRLNGSVLNLKDSSVLNVKFVGVGYIKYEKGGVTQYAFGTTSEENARSVAEVAQKAYYNEDVDEAQKVALGEAYVQRYLDLYKTKNGAYPTVNYTETVNLETKNGFKEVTASEKSITVETYDAKIPGTQTPVMLDGSAKVQGGYVYNENQTADSTSLSEDDLFNLNLYTAEEGVVSKSTEWSVDGTSICIDFSKTTSSWHGFYGANSLSFNTSRYVSFIAYMEDGYPEFSGNAFWVDGTKSVEKQFTLDPGVPKRIEFDLGSYSKITTFAFQKHPYRPDSKLYIDDVRFYNKTPDSAPIDPVLLTEDNILTISVPKLYYGEGGEASVTKSSVWSVDGKSESLCFDFSKCVRSDDWMGVFGNAAYDWGASKKYLSFVAYSDKDYDTSGIAFWHDVIYTDITLKAGVPTRFVFEISKSNMTTFTFQCPADKSCKLYIDDIKVYDEQMTQDPGLYSKTYKDGDKATVVAGFTSLVTASDAEVVLTISYQAEGSEEWVALAAENTACAIGGTLDLTTVKKYKVKVTATSQGATLAEQILEVVGETVSEVA